MKRSASTAEFSSEREESLHAVEPAHADLYGVQGQRDVGEDSAQAARGASPPPMRASSGLESCRVLDDEVDTTQGNSGIAVQPTQAAIQADSGVAVQLVQVGSSIESQNFQEEPNVEEGVIQPIGNVVVQPVQANLGHEHQSLPEQPSAEGREAQLDLEFCSFQDVSTGTFQANRGDAAQPTEAGLESESHNFQEQPNVRESAIHAGSNAAVQLTGASSRIELHNFEELQPNVEEGCTHPSLGAIMRPMQAGLRLEFQNFQEQPNIEESGGVGLQPTQGALPGPLTQGNDTRQTLTDEQVRLIVELAHFVSCNTSDPGHVQAGIPNPVLEETGSTEGSVPQTPTSDTDYQGDGQGETSHQEEEEEAGMQDRIEEEVSPNDMENLRRVGWIELADLDEPMDAEEDIVIQAQVSEEEMQGLDELVDDEADSGMFQIQEDQRVQMTECMLNTDYYEALMSIDDIHNTLNAFTEEKIDAKIEELVQLMFADQCTNNPRHVQAGASHSEEQIGSNDGNASQTSSSNREDLRKGAGETLHQEEEGGLNDRFEWQASPVHVNEPMDDEEDIAIQASAGEQQVQALGEPMDDEEDSGIQVQAGQQQMQDAPPQKGTAGRRMRLQVPLCGADGLIEQSAFGLPQVICI